jgi:nitrile hydratase subunit beta
MSYQNHADLGGQENAQTVVPEPEGELFHASWEPAALALTLAAGGTGAWNIDMSRRVRETLPHYGELSYYAIWLQALERLLLETGLITEAELVQGVALQPSKPVPRTLRANEVASALAKGSPTLREPTRPAQFAVGDKVRTRAGTVDHHTRLPAYAQGKCGVIERVHGAHVFADANAHGRGEAPQWLYGVCFQGVALWGDDAAPWLINTLDAWESYLEPAP